MKSTGNKPASIDDLLASKSEYISYSLAEGSDRYCEGIDFGVKAVRLGKMVLLYVCSENQEIMDEMHGLQLASIASLPEVIPHLWWEYDCEANGIPVPDLSLDRVEGLEDCTALAGEILDSEFSCDVCDESYKPSHILSMIMYADHASSPGRWGWNGQTLMVAPYDRVRTGMLTSRFVYPKGLVGIMKNLYLDVTEVDAMPVPNDDDYVSTLEQILLDRNALEIENEISNREWDIEKAEARIEKLKSEIHELNKSLKEAKEKCVTASLDRNPPPELQ